MNEDDLMGLSEYDMGRFVESLDGLRANVSKLEAKIDFFLKEAVSRREFEDVSKKLTLLEASHNALRSVQDKVSWVPQIIWSGCTIILATVINRFLGG